MLTVSTIDHASKPASSLAGAASKFAELDVGESTNVDTTETTVVVIDSRQLARECFARSLVAHNPEINVISFGSVEEWRRANARLGDQAVILLNIGTRRITELGIAGDISRMVSEAQPVPVVVIADTEELPQIVKALECGAKGFIPTTVSISVAAEAIELALAGGIFVPASSIMAMRSVINSNAAGDRPLSGLFTARQMAVVEALRRGKANKIIAYELNLRESTVKVHIRNIMKKLKATNRTEVAFKIRDMFPDQSGPDI